MIRTRAFWRALPGRKGVSETGTLFRLITVPAQELLRSKHFQFSLPFCSRFPFEVWVNDSGFGRIEHHDWQSHSTLFNGAEQFLKEIRVQYQKKSIMDVGQLKCYQCHDGHCNYTSFNHNSYTHNFGTFSSISISCSFVSQFFLNLIFICCFYLLLNNRNGELVTYLTSPKLLDI